MYRTIALTVTEVKCNTARYGT